MKLTPAQPHPLKDRIEAARDELARLERIAASASCAEVGHVWKSIGGTNCGCDEDACCSVPVNHCEKCGDCDYGENEEASEKRRLCRELLP